MKHSILAAVALLASPAMAHGGHDEKAQQRAPADAARQYIVRLVTQSKLAPSWSKATVRSIAPRNVNGARQTVVTFVNPAEAAAQSTLHVAIQADGTVVSATPSSK